jgi:hypothetical protein
MTTPEIKVSEITPDISQNPVKEAEKPSETASSSQSIVTPTPGPFIQTPAVATPQDTGSSQPQNQHTVTITIPATKDQLDDWAKGPADTSLTWDATYWLRMIRKAVLYGWGVSVGPKA